MAELSQRQGREILYVELKDGTRELRLGAQTNVDPPLRGDILDLMHTQPTHGLPSRDDSRVLRIIIKMGSPLRELKVIALDGTLYIHHLDDLGRPLRGLRGRLRITVVPPN
jgi:hypothetical protein